MPNFFTYGAIFSLLLSLSLSLSLSIFPDFIFACLSIQYGMCLFLVDVENTVF